MNSAKRTMKELVKPFVPQILKNWRWNRIARRHRELAERLWKSSDGVVLSGVFQGMKYTSKASGSMLGPKILGTYELEIHDWVESAIDAHYDTLIDIGAAEGFYAVGFLYRSPKLMAHSFDINTGCHELQSNLAALNGVSGRLAIHKEYEHTWFTNHRSGFGKVLFFVDIDGGEDNLLDPKKFPCLIGVDLIVETHDCFVPGVTDRIIERFADSHSIKRLPSLPRHLRQSVFNKLPAGR